MTTYQAILGGMALGPWADRHTEVERNDTVLPRAASLRAGLAERGRVISFSPCQMHGCSGLRVWVRWPDGKLTKPCSKALVQEGPGVYRIT